MTKVDLVKLSNMLSWYFCETQYPKIQTKLSEPVSKLYNELQQLRNEQEKVNNTTVKEK